MHVSTAGVIASAPVAWASSSTFLTVPFGAILRTFDVSQSPPRCIASHIGHTSPVTSVISLSDMRVASASKDGTLRIWDIQGGNCLRTFDIGRPLSSIDLLSSAKILSYANQELNIIEFGIKVKRRSRMITRSHLQIVKSEEGVIVSGKDSNMVAIIEGNALHITTKDGVEPLLTVPHRKLLTSVAITADASKLAVGDEMGVIWVYHDVANLLSMLKKGRNIRRPSSLGVSKLHWHPSAVQGLSFGHQGRVLLSGGNETVLVSWQMSRTNFGVKTFLSSLKAPILGIIVSPDEKLYATTHSDNAVRIIDQRTGTVVETIRGVASRLLHISQDNPKHLFSSRVDPSLLNHFAAVNDRMNPSRLWLTGTGSTIQLFDVCKGVQVEEHAVAPRNSTAQQKQRNEKHERPGELVVTAVAVHKKRDLIATIDHQDLRTENTNFYGAKKGADTLRLWNRTEDGDFNLITVINEPHGSGNPVTDLSFHPYLPYLSTTSSCGTFRLWSETGSETNSWRCESEKTYKDLPSHAVAFSGDGSLQAVAFGNLITIWTIETTEGLEDAQYMQVTNEEKKGSCSTITFELLRVLVHPPHHELVRKLIFVSDTVPILLATTKYCLYAWNVITQGIWWSHRFLCDPDSMVLDEDSNRVAISIHIPPLVASSNRLYVDGNESRTIHNSQPGDIVNRKLSSFSEKDTDCVKTHKLDSLATEKRGLRAGEQEKANELDTAIAVFSSASPVPTNVFRLSPGLKVAALAFVRLGGASTCSNRSLVSFDSNLKVTLHPTYQSPEDTSSAITEELLASTPAAQGDEQKGNLDRILGDAWQDDYRESNKNQDDTKIRISDSIHNDAFPKGTDISKYKDVTFALSQAFCGAVDVQGSVMPRLTQFMDTLLLSRRRLCGDESESTGAQNLKNGGNTNENSKKNGLPLRPNSPDVKKTSEAKSRSFCRSLILLEHPRSSKTRS
eukprot:TRINITY_DN935_c0_g1_i1.p1 TRINITY_DN935_c0_g1~~TRINITY_DN935_c0_g1_i1.p1  ORF type:complete len:957 (-),score=116.06 TRINITY_DN935_c0_g1_i1:4560-7430(-)